MNDHWQQQARGILKGELARRGMSYEALALRLRHLGVRENARQLGNKINRGTFSFRFFLQCMRALDVDVVRLFESGARDTTGTP